MDKIELECLESGRSPISKESTVDLSDWGLPNLGGMSPEKRATLDGEVIMYPRRLF